MLNFVTRRGGGRGPERPQRLPLGVEIGARFIRVARYHRFADGTVVLERATSRPIVGSGSVAELASILSVALDEIGVSRSVVNRPLAVLSLGDDASLVRRVAMSQISGGRRQRAAAYKAADPRTFGSWKLENCIVKARPIPDDPTAFLVAKTRKDELERCASIMRLAGLRPRIEHRSFSLARALPDAEAILDIGATASTLYAYVRDNGKELVRAPIALALQDGSLRVASGGEDVTRTIMRSMQLSEEEAEARKRREGLDLSPTISDVEALAFEVGSLLGRLRQDANAHVNRLTLVGGGARLKGLAEYLSELIVGCEVEVAQLPQLRGSEPASVLAARAPELAVTLGCALYGAEQSPVARMSLVGRDLDALTPLAVDARRLQQAAVAPIIAVAVVAGAYCVEGWRVADAVATADRQEQRALAKEHEAAKVTELKTNVEQLLAVYTALSKVRSSAVDRADELDDIAGKIPANVRIVSTTTTTDGWRLEGKARSHADVGREVLALRKVFPNVTAVTPPTATRPDGSPNDPVTYTVDIHRVAAQQQASRGPAPFAPIPVIAVIALGTGLRRRVPFDRRLLFLATFAIAGGGYVATVYHGETLYGDAVRREAEYKQREDDASAAIQLQTGLADAKSQLTGGIRNLWPQRDASTLLGTAQIVFDDLGRKRATYRENGAEFVSGVYMQGWATAPLTDASGASRPDIAAAPAGAPTAAPTAKKDQVEAPAARDVATRGVVDQYSIVVPVTVVYNGPYKAVMDTLRSIAKAEVLANVSSASIQVEKPDPDAPTMKLTLSVGLLMPVEFGPSGELVRKTGAPPAARRRLKIGVPDAGAPAPSSSLPAVAP